MACEGLRLAGEGVGECPALNLETLCSREITVTVCHSAKGYRFGNVTLSPTMILFPSVKHGVAEVRLPPQNGHPSGENSGEADRSMPLLLRSG